VVIAILASDDPKTQQVLIDEFKAQVDSGFATVPVSNFVVSACEGDEEYDS
jgi:hypothetical protein